MPTDSFFGGGVAADPKKKKKNTAAPMDVSSAESFLDTAIGDAKWNDVVGPLANRASLGLQGVVREGFNVGAENDRRFASSAERLTGSVDSLQPSFTDDDFNQLFALEADRDSAEFEKSLGLLSDSLGIRGVSGGVAADLAATSHAEFQKNLANAKGNLRVAKIQSDAQDSMRNLNAEFALSNFTSQPADETRMASMAAFASGSADLAGLFAQVSAIQGQKKAANKAANLSLIGSAIGGLGAAL